MNKINFVYYNTVSDLKILENVKRYLNYFQKNNINLFVIHENYHCKRNFKLCLTNEKKLDINIISQTYFDDQNNINEIINFLKKNEIKMVNFFNGNLSVYKIQNILHICKVLDTLNIKFYWNTMSFLKHRFLICDDIYFNNSKIISRYYANLNNSVNFSKIERYKSEYWNIKIGKFYWTDPEELCPCGSQKKFKLCHGKKNNYINFKSKLSEIKNIFFSKNITRVNQSALDNRKKYILFLATKNSHWFNKYANPKFQNPVDYIHDIEKSIPHEFDLLIKPHPKETYIFDKTSLSSRSFIYSGSLKEVIDHSELIISTGSSSGLEALTLNKKIIYLGDKTYLGKIKKELSPVQIINDIEQLPDKVLELINTKLSKNQINCYLESLIQNSFEVNKYDQLLRGDSFAHDNYRAVLEKIKNDFEIETQLD